MRILLSLHASRLISLVLMISFSACTKHPHSSQLFQLRSAEETGIDFSNVLFEDANLNIITFEYFYNGAGVAIGDVNNDDLPDIFFASNMQSCRLYLNEGKLRFRDASKEWGIDTRGQWATGVSMIDVNQDGCLDIYVCMAGPHKAEKRANKLYINQAGKGFEDQAEAYGLADTGHSTQAAFFDYDRDGDLDMYLLTNITEAIGPNIIRPKKLKGESPNTDRLYRNEGNNTFTNVSAEAGILAEGYGLGVSITDINQDGWPDIYVSNDYLSNDLLYINQQAGSFKEEAASYFAHTSYSAMGHDIADLNNDGLQEIYTLDMLPEDNKRRKLMFGSSNYDRYLSELQEGYHPQFMRNTLQLNRGKNAQGKHVFSEIGQLAGVHSTDWSWSALMADYDGDGYRDLFVSNGYPRDITNRDFADYKMDEFSQAQYDPQMQLRFIHAINDLAGAYLPNYIFQNQQGLRFKNTTQDWGLGQASYSHGAAFGDLDKDGDLDLVINNTSEKAFVYENQSEQNPDYYYLQCELIGSEQNPAGIGAQVEIWADSLYQFHEHRLSRGYLSSVEPLIQFGLGKHTGVDSLRVKWPDAKVQVLYNLKSNQRIELAYTKSKAFATTQESHRASRLFKKNTDSLFNAHQEAFFVDFKRQALVPHLHSRLGPALAVGDLNGDGQEDLVMGGAAGQATQIRIGNTEGSFTSQTFFPQHAKYEDLGILCFDADEDGDKDLYIASGSSEFEPGSTLYQDRLYKNNGQGSFRWDAKALPAISSSTASVSACDYDRDGDLDLFVGGRISPSQYPKTPRSYLLENQGGKFVDQTAALAPQLAQAGMISAALWTDVNQDDWMDLIVVGEWTPIQIFLNHQGKFSPFRPESLKETKGWWNSIQGVDLDVDGDTDYVLGNRGLNGLYQTYPQTPLSLYAYDLEQVDRAVPFMFYSQKDTFYPTAARDEMLSQVYSFRKRFPKYADYAQASLTDILSPAQQAEAAYYAADQFQSVWMENLGEGQFAIHPLPIEAQMAPVFGMEWGYFNEDALPDLFLVGNFYSTDALSGPYDASRGLVLINQGKSFQAISPAKSGIDMAGDAKALVRVRDSKGRLSYIASRNDENPQRYTLNQSEHLRAMNLPEDIQSVWLQRKGEARQHVELYRGAGYLSQSSRRLMIPKEVLQLEVLNRKGERQVLTVESLP